MPEDLERFGVVNQTTMLASDTQAIADHLKLALEHRDGGKADRFASHARHPLLRPPWTTRQRQRVLWRRAQVDIDLAFVVGGYNSSNTSHLVELCQDQMPTWYVRSAEEFEGDGGLGHFNLITGKRESAENWWTVDLPEGKVPTVLLTSGASCPDSAVDRVLQKILERFGGGRAVDDVLRDFAQEQANLENE